MNSNVMPTRTIIITSPKDNLMCQNIINALKDQETVKKLQENYINIMQQDGGNGFKADFYDFNMRLIQSLNITNVQELFKQAIEIAQKMGLPGKAEPKPKQVGGYIDYEQKYKKYKKKYNMMKNSVTGYY